MLPIKSMYVGSRHNADDAISDSNIKFTLPHT